ncbi:hypothetical protein G6F70_003593 [Rhizopus microsporus]|nr:hypothetical protein G6F71_002068 [Rhizopus microsporus]KAG1200964.1 hypothetical protein G6F70_003593 [Rhizopus microsporus]KAG1212795.1 hypothetical protein G6F69_003400 [Rhizopus microsporus]KAG1236415.1 hypothetical protein G6F67_002018 [Rhizopus microsporus]KAG1268265.1 hypothetical protein G6F68_001234 [Rhizopus microsporus]
MYFQANQKDMSESRFSVNSNLMNYSIPTETGVDHKREIKQGDSDTRTRQLEAQIEQLTLQNVKLQRTNRLLKVDTDNLIEQRTSPLEKMIEELTIANIKLQRTTRLLQQELDEKTEQLNRLKENQILQMKSVGPEYEFLVQNINLLQRQLAGHPICEGTCCFTMKPVDHSTMVMTLPSTDNDEDGEEELEAQHICRPVIHSDISQGSYATELEHRIIRLEQIIEELDQEKEQILRQQSYKDNDLETLKKELKIKDEIVSQLEQDFMCLEDQLEHLQKQLQEKGTDGMNRPSSSLIPQDLKRQSQLLMESKRRSLAIKDTHLLEQMLKGDLAVGGEEGPNYTHSGISSSTSSSSSSSSSSYSNINSSDESIDNQDKKEEEFEQVNKVASTKPKMAWDDEDAEDINNNVKEDWDESEEEEPKKEQKVETKTVTPPVKKNLTLKQKIAEKEALLKEQKKKKAALANRFLDGETEEEKFERVHGIKGGEGEGEETAEAPKKAPSKPVESLKPRTRADFEEFRQLLTDMILQHSNVSGYATFLEQLARDLADPMKDMDIRKAASSLTALANDKQRQQREALKNNKKAKGKGQSAKTAAPAPAAPTREYSTTYDDFDDFM